MVTMIVKTHFDAAHFLPNYDGPCHNIHGHRWNVDVELSGRADKDSGMVVDFGEVKDSINDLLPDHDLVNDHVSNPTAENISVFLFRKIKRDLLSTHPQVKLVSITIWETDKCGVRCASERG